MSLSLTQLDINNIPSLKTVYCQNNNLTELNISNCPSLEELYCSTNQLTSLNLSGLPSLKSIDCTYNQLANLDVSACTSLEKLECDSNSLGATALNDLFGTLPNYSSTPGSGNIFIGGNIGAGGCTRTIATTKGWTVFGT